MKYMTYIILFITGCQTIQFDYDPITRISLPEVCNRDLTNVVNATIRSVPQQIIVKVTGVKKALGVAFLGKEKDNEQLYSKMGRRIIWIDKNLRGWRYEVIKHHEECHFVAGKFHRRYTE